MRFSLSLIDFSQAQESWEKHFAGFNAIFIDKKIFYKFGDQSKSNSRKWRLCHLTSVIGSFFLIMLKVEWKKPEFVKNFNF